MRAKGGGGAEKLLLAQQVANDVNPLTLCPNQLIGRTMGRTKFNERISPIGPPLKTCSDFKLKPDACFARGFIKGPKKRETPVRVLLLGVNYSVMSDSLEENFSLKRPRPLSVPPRALRNDFCF